MKASMWAQSCKIKNLLARSVRWPASEFRAAAVCMCQHMFVAFHIRVTEDFALNMSLYALGFKHGHFIL